MTKRKPVIVLAGPTAVGKTDLSLKLARAVNGAVVSADSMQIYKYMDIGSAKIMAEERDGIDHYLIDCLEPEDEFNVFVFQKLAKEAMNRIWEMGKVPIITGGTGFYIQAVLRDIDFSEDDGKAELRSRLEQMALENGPDYMHDLLKERDPAAAAEIHPNNVKRVIRALEFYEQTGTKISAHNEEQREKESPYCFIYFVLNDIRSRLYERIDLRVDKMVEAGLVDEVRMLKARGLTCDHVSMKGLGYKELFPYLDGECSLDEAVEIIKRDTRHFAKRQITWFKREADVVWINKDAYEYDEEKMLADMVRMWNIKQTEDKEE